MVVEGHIAVGPCEHMRFERPQMSVQGRTVHTGLPKRKGVIHKYKDWIYIYYFLVVSLS